MKKLSTFVACVLMLAACGSNPTDIAAEYGLSQEQYLEMKAAAEGMGMNVEDHLRSLGFTPNR